MKLEIYDVPYEAGMVYKLTISRSEMARAEFDRFDRALLAEVETADDVTIADRLLALEVVARRIEQSESEVTA